MQRGKRFFIEGWVGRGLATNLPSAKSDLGEGDTADGFVFHGWNYKHKWAESANLWDFSATLVATLLEKTYININPCTLDTQEDHLKKDEKQ
jgi:hypothetical protein